MNLLSKFRGNRKTAAPSIPDERNPYLNARRTWKTYVGGVLAMRDMSILGGLLCLLIALAAVGGLIHIGSMSKFIPLVVREDAGGHQISVTRGDRIGQAQDGDYAEAVAGFIEDLRLVTPDAALQRKAVLRAYCHLNPADPALAKSNEWLNGTESSSPFVRAGKETVTTEFQSVLKQTDGSWEVEWIEKTMDRKTGLVKGKPFTMRALITVYQSAPTDKSTEEEVLCNARFIFIKDFNWTKKL